jgi:probable rRNA maturation factor
MIRVAVSNRQHTITLDVPRLKRRARRVLRDMGLAETELSVVFVDDDEMRRLNATYRSLDRPTDVLAFAMTEGAFGDLNPGLLGDVVISTQTAQRQAERAGRSGDDELDALLVHGILHLIGYDHERSAADARTMRNQERRLRRLLQTTA